MKGQTPLNFLGKLKVGSTQSTPHVKLSQHNHQTLQMNAINAAALDSSPLSRYEKERTKIVKNGSKVWDTIRRKLQSYTQHIIDRTNLTGNYLPKRDEEVCADILKSGHQ